VLKTQSKVIEVYQKKVCYNVDLLPLYDKPDLINSETLRNIRNLVTANLEEQIETLESIAEHSAVQDARLLMNNTVKETLAATTIMSEAGIRKILLEIFPQVISNRFDLSDQVDWILSYDHLIKELHDLIKELPDFETKKQLFLKDYSILGLGK
jgi:spore coat protein CotF